jgi:hypothetical protein
VLDKDLASFKLAVVESGASHSLWAKVAILLNVFTDPYVRVCQLKSCLVISAHQVERLDFQR